MSARQRGEETRTRILEVAEEGFARNGYDGTGVAEICKQAGLSKGAFYHHFPSKQALFLELLEHWLQGLEEEFRRIRAGADTVPQALDRMADMVQHVFQAADGKLPIFLEFWTQAARDPAIWQATIAPYRRFRALFTQWIEEGVAEGSLRTPDPERAAEVLISMAVGIILQGLLDPYGADWGQVAREGVKTFLAGLGAEPQT